MIEYITKYYNDIFIMFFEHLEITVLSLGISLMFALPFGYILAKVKHIAMPSLSVLGILYAIPSMALFALLIPLMGLGMKPAITGLVAYSQLILVRNTMVGIKSIDASVLEAGRGMGLSALQLFWKVQFPLALPVIIGGIRIATTSIIGIGTIAAWTNAGGLGELLFQGLYQNVWYKIVIGCILVSILAITANQSLLWLEKRSSLKARGEI